MRCKKGLSAKYVCVYIPAKWVCTCAGNHASKEASLSVYNTPHTSSPGHSNAKSFDGVMVDLADCSPVLNYPQHP